MTEYINPGIFINNSVDSDRDFTNYLDLQKIYIRCQEYDEFGSQEDQKEIYKLLVMLWTDGLNNTQKTYASYTADIYRKQLYKQHRKHENER